MPITRYAPPKINLNLRITGRRADGYHELESLVVFGGRESGDCVVYEPAEPYGLKVQGEFAKDTPGDDRNLILKMAQLVQAACPDMTIGHFTLSKNLPVASGIGGGTMDAIAALRCLQQAHDIPDNACMALANRIGADGAACWHQQPLIMRGIGEQIEVIEWGAPQHMLLINPRVQLETAAVFRVYASAVIARRPQADAAIQKTTVSDISGLPRRYAPRNDGVYSNDLLPAAIELCPAIQDILTFLNAHNASYASMSGSGATCFGVFETAEDVQHALEAMPKAWWGMIV